MSRVLPLGLALLLVSTALAGCTLGGDDPAPGTTTTTDPTTTTPDATTTPATTTPVTSTPVTTTPPPSGQLSNATYTLETVGVPSQVEIAKAFNFTLYVNGSTSVSSDHVGAHYGASPSTEPSLAVYDKACEHQAGTLPGMFVVTCNLTAEGTWYLRGHARVTQAGETFNWWSAENTVIVRNWTLTATNVPQTAVSNVTFNFRLNITGNGTVFSDHIGAHYGPNSTASPSLAVYNKACQHQTGDVPGEYTVTCQIENPTLSPMTVYLRGHLRYTEAGSAVNFWTKEYAITVAAGVL